MSTNQTRRPAFYEEQYLGAADLTAAVEYGRTQMARHSLGAHTWGIAMGLQLKEVETSPDGDGPDVYLQPGYAWDGFGRPVVVLAPYKIPAERFRSFTYDATIDDGDPEGRLVEVWLRYDEFATQSPRPGFEVCDVEDQYSRVQETFKIEVGERRNHSDRHDPISIAGYSVDAKDALQRLDPQTPPIELFDESVPYQTFPGTGEKRRWLIPLGYVRWKPNPDASQPGRFVEMADADRERSRRFRRHIGVVAEGLEAADGVIRMHDRTRAYSTVWTDDLVWIEGDLRVEGDAKVFGGKIDFRDANGADQGVPLWIQRVEDNGVGGKDLRVRIGQNENGDHRLAVGPQVGTDFHARLVVRDDGKVGIGAATPEHRLQIGDASAPVSVSLRGPDGNAESGVLAFEDDGGIGQRCFRFINDTQNDKLKVRSPEQDHIMVLERVSGKVGIGTESPAGRMTLKGIVDPEQGSLTFFSNTADFEYDGGSDGLFIFKDTGGKTAFIGGNVGIGTTSPIVPLHIAPNSNNFALRIDQGSNGNGLLAYVNTASDERTVLTAASNVVGLYVKGNGHVGIGTTTPSARLHIHSPGATSGILVTGPTIADVEIGKSTLELDSPEKFRIGTNNIERLRITSNGRVGIGTTNPSYLLHVNGSAAKPGGGHWTNPSDQRLKKNIEPLTGALSKLTKLRGIYFEWKEPEKQGNLTGKQMGLIAQEVEQVFPEWVGVDPEGFKDLTIRGFEALTVEAFKELKQEIDALKSAQKESTRKSKSGTKIRDKK